MCITRVMPMEEKQYTSRAGEQKIFTSRALLLSDGIDTLCVEVIGDNARREEWPLNQWCSFSITCSTREYTDKNGKTRFSNEMIVSRIGL